MPTTPELKAMYDLGMRNCYAVDHEMRLLAKLKLGIGAFEIYPKITKLTEDRFHIIALDYDLGRFKNDLMLLEAKNKIEPGSMETGIAFIIGMIDKQTKTRDHLLAIMPDQMEEMRKLLME